MSESIRLEVLNAENWEQCAALKVLPEQEKYIQTNAFVMARSLFEPLKLFAIYRREEVLGMLALYCKNQVLWISHLMISGEYQSCGIGHKVLELIPTSCVKKSQFAEMRVGVMEGNQSGMHFFRSEGFILSTQLPDGEYILRKG